MSGSEIFKQHDMFTAELVDNRSSRQKRADKRRSEPEQQAMFKLSEVLGDVKTRPVIDTTHLASEILVLISEDTRSAEEKEADLRRAAEALTEPMFVDRLDEDKVINQACHAHQLEVQSVGEDVIQLEKQLKSPQEGVYLELVEVVCERITTLWIDNNYEPQFHLQLAGAILAAQDVGLSLPEISVAIQIGKYLGEQKRVGLDVLPPTLSEKNGAVGSEIAPQRPSKAPIVDGFRARARRENRKLRRRRLKQVA